MVGHSATEYISSSSMKVNLDSGERPDSRGPPRIIQSAVLNAPGQLFGLEKVQNEVSCLLKLEQNLPSIPTPKVLAWSDDGIKVGRVIRSVGSKSLVVKKAESSHEPRRETASGTRGWILTSQCPGILLQATALTGPNSAHKATASRPHGNVEKERV
jgi:hypothetical protein